MRVFEKLTDKELKAKIDNVVISVETEYIRVKEVQTKELERETELLQEVEKSLGEMKNISLKNNYANRVITDVSTNVNKFEVFLEQSKERELGLEVILNEVNNACQKETNGYTKYDMNYWNITLPIFEFFGFTKPLSEEELDLRERVIEHGKKNKKEEEDEVVLEN